GLVIVTRAESELSCGGGIKPLPPQRALHGENYFVGSAPAAGVNFRDPSHAAGAAGELRQIHLAVVIVVRQLNLLQYRQALGGQRNGRQRPQHDRGESAQSSSPKRNKTYYPKTSSSLAAKFNSEQAAMLTRLANKTGNPRPCTKIGMRSRLPTSEMAP